MELKKQYCIYSVDTGAFYFPEEVEIEKRLNKFRAEKQRYKAVLESCGDPLIRYVISEKISYLNKRIKGSKECLIDILKVNIRKVRNLNTKKLCPQNRISIFDSALTRCFELVPENHDVKQTVENTVVNEEIMSVTVFYFEVLESLIHNGYTHNGQHYKYFASSAGAIRTKRGMFVREDLLEKHWNKLTAGLTFDDINKKGGMNINKLNAYLALCSSATDVWDKFDIDRCIVVDDFETNVVTEVDYVNDMDYSITRQTMPVSIPHTDGAGLVSTEISKKNFMFRLPFFKGLLCAMPFKDFIAEKNCSGKVKDIWGKEWDVVADNIQIIFTKSQFKMYKYYDSWDEYKNNFKKYQCEACVGKADDSYFKKSRMNYQMISSFIDYDDNELKSMCKETVDFINGICSDKEKQLELFGVKEGKPFEKYNGLQKCLYEYNGLLRDRYCREQLGDLRAKLIKDLYSAKFKINGYYTFLVPDVYAFCEWLFMGIEVPQGLLKQHEVHCKLHKFDKKVDCLRSPHLYFEHSIQNNVTNDEIEKWFVTKGCYTSTHDLISKILMFDVDGDNTLIVQDDLMIELAERNQNNVVPLYYNMHKASAVEINADNRYKGLSVAFTGGNIGVVANNIAKVKNSPEIVNEKTRDEAINVLRWSCLISNETIDFAKTLYKSTPPDEINKTIRKYVNRKLPHFFVYAKDKTENQVEPVSDAIVDRIYTLYPQEKFKLTFTDKKKFDYKMLMKNPDIKVDEKVLRIYSDKVSNIKLLKHKKDERGLNNILVSDIIATMSKLRYKQVDICDMLIKDMFKTHTVFKDGRCKEFFFIIYGDIVYNNICHNKEKRVLCVDCGEEFERASSLQCRCKKCNSAYRTKYKTENQFKNRKLKM